MPNNESTIVPLDAAHEVLSVFGIGSDNREYQRWRQDDGFRLIDLEDVLGHSQFVLSVDWREALPDALSTILDQLGAIGISASSDLADEADEGQLEIDGQNAAVKFVPSDGDDFDQVIRTVNSLISAKARYRKFRSSEGSDGWMYGLLSSEEWNSLEAEASDLTALLFDDVGAGTVEVIEGDLLDQDVEVIVNAWNRNIIPWWLLLPQGVSGAIKRRGGTGPFKELAKHGPIPLGEAVLTSAGKLPFKAIIHVAGINMLWRASERSIRDSVRNALTLAHEHGFHSIALPLIGAGSGGFNVERTKSVILDELQKLNSPLDVRVVVYRR